MQSIIINTIKNRKELNWNFLSNKTVQFETNWIAFIWLDGKSTSIVCVFIADHIYCTLCTDDLCIPPKQSSAKS